MPKKWIVIGVSVVTALSVLFGLYHYYKPREQVVSLERKSPGMGETEFHLEVWTDEGHFPLDIQLEERVYSDEELDTIFEETKLWLDKVWIGENTSVDEIKNDLYFPSYANEYGIRIRWELENYQWIQADGKITEKAFEIAPLSTYVKAILSYGETERTYTYEITIKEERKEEVSELEQSIMNEIQALKSENQEERSVILPERVQGTNLRWYSQESPIWPKIFVFGNVLVLLLWFSGEERKFQKLKERNAELNQDYPEIVYRLVLLIGAGMTVKSAWEKVIEGYKREKETTGKSRWGYEEMEMTLREMNYGIAEMKAYENFGKRCESQNYVRLATLLIQQVKRGAKGMNQLLMQEVSSAEILWRENSRKKAEEAGTKLLLPMVLLMSVVFAVLMIPAFLSMSI